jgi:hypothetical protein
MLLLLAHASPNKRERAQAERWGYNLKITERLGKCGSLVLLWRLFGPTVACRVRHFRDPCLTPTSPVSRHSSNIDHAPQQ